MGELEKVLGTLPAVAPETADVFDIEHGHANQQDLDGILRTIETTNPGFMDEIDRIANRALVDVSLGDPTLASSGDGGAFGAKTRIIQGAVLAYALLGRQGEVNELDARFQATEVIDVRDRQRAPRTRRFFGSRVALFTIASAFGTRKPSHGDGV